MKGRKALPLEWEGRRGKGYILSQLVQSHRKKGQLGGRSEGKSHSAEKTTETCDDEGRGTELSKHYAWGVNRLAQVR